MSEISAAQYQPEIHRAKTIKPSRAKKAVDEKLAMNPMHRVKLFPETSLSIEVDDLHKSNHKFRVTGRADWAFGYNANGDGGSLLVAIEAKQISEFSRGEAQLIAYLAILSWKPH